MGQAANPVMNPPADESTIGLPRLVAREATRADAASAVEAEVLSLFDAFRDPLLRYVCGFGISVGDGEDVIQEVFLALFQHLRKNGSRSNLQGWLFRVAHNLALKRRAQQRREHRYVHADDDVARHRPDPGDDPEEQLADRDRRRRASAVFNALPERDRHCVQLRGHGLGYREIAQVVGISLGSVAKSLTRAVARLQRAIEG